jgi:3',5'-nucleoside bisphosphate phosphatase
MRLDLHAHSSASDGEVAPAALVALAAEEGVGLLALTDHDTMAGVGEAIAAGRRHGVRVLPAIELSARTPRGSLHLLGYFPSPDPHPLSDRLAELAAGRLRRAREILDRLAALGVPVDMRVVRALADGPVGRPHIADAMVAAGHVADRREAFERYLHDGGPAHVPSRGFAPEEAVRVVAESGGAPVLAHPASLGLPARQLAATVQRLAARGLRGIEVHRPEHTPEQRRQFATLGRRLGLVATGGSDFHRPGGLPRLGHTGDPPLPPDVVQRLLPRAFS